MSEVTDKIRGGLLGQILGNLNGLAHEMKYISHPGSVTNYVPSLPQGAWTDDDTDFEWVYVAEMQKQRKPLLSSDEIYNLWKERINRRIWCSNRYARYLMDIGFKPPATGSTLLNPWAEFNVSGQFLCETFALMAPVYPEIFLLTNMMPSIRYWNLVFLILQCQQGVFIIIRMAGPYQMF